MLNPANIQKIAYYLYYKKIPFVPALITLFVRFLYFCYFSHRCKAGKRLILGYGDLGPVIHPDTIIGDDVHIDQQVNIDGKATD